MSAKGRCHCGAITYEVSGEPIYHALCHCNDCRLASGAPATSWALFPREAVVVNGSPKERVSSANARRQFCGECGSGMFYLNDVTFPGMVDIQSATLENPAVFPLEVQIQTAERISWMATAHDLPQFERYPEE